MGADVRLTLDEDRSPLLYTCSSIATSIQGQMRLSASRIVRAPRLTLLCAPICRAHVDENDERHSQIHVSPCYCSSRSAVPARTGLGPSARLYSGPAFDSAGKLLVRLVIAAPLWRPSVRNPFWPAFTSAKCIVRRAWSHSIMAAYPCTLENQASKSPIRCTITNRLCFASSATTEESVPISNAVSIPALARRPAEASAHRGHGRAILASTSGHHGQRIITRRRRRSHGAVLPCVVACVLYNDGVIVNDAHLCMCLAAFSGRCYCQPCALFVGGGRASRLCFCVILSCLELAIATRRSQCRSRGCYHGFCCCCCCCCR